MDLWAVFPTGRMASAKAREFASFVETCISGDAERVAEETSDRVRHNAREPPFILGWNIY
jgi:hypothetical protein